MEKNSNKNSVDSKLKSMISNHDMLLLMRKTMNKGCERTILSLMSGVATELELEFLEHVRSESSKLSKIRVLPVKAKFKILFSEFVERRRQIGDFDFCLISSINKEEHAAGLSDNKLIEAFFEEGRTNYIKSISI